MRIVVFGTYSLDVQQVTSGTNITLCYISNIIDTFVGMGLLFNDTYHQS